MVVVDELNLVWHREWDVAWKLLKSIHLVPNWTSRLFGTRIINLSILYSFQLYVAVAFGYLNFLQRRMRVVGGCWGEDSNLHPTEHQMVALPLALSRYACRRYAANMPSKSHSKAPLELECSYKVVGGQLITSEYLEIRIYGLNPHPERPWTTYIIPFNNVWRTCSILCNLSAFGICLTPLGAYLFMRVYSTPDDNRIVVAAKWNF